uniref:Polymerase delta-interacting protein 3-like n=1 Tax=Saccoglossus kowalevskii TaxID=10224 RepID=A0ABM0MG66_SACKO|nr:PREDICTED: polymerase delta-interacting protein 3-like [Saccoglossus kowalevskii]
MSLDEVIARRKIQGSGSRGRGRGRGRGAGMVQTKTPVLNLQSNRGRMSTSQGHLSTNRGQFNVRTNLQSSVPDARQKLMQKARLTDARERLNQKAKKTDARMKLIAKRSKQPDINVEEQEIQSGHIDMTTGTPTITISNPEAPTATPKVTIMNPRAQLITLHNPKIHNPNMAASRLSNKVQSTKGQLKITTINEMAKKRKAGPVRHIPVLGRVKMNMQEEELEDEEMEEEYEYDIDDEEEIEEELEEEMTPPPPPKLTRILKKPAAPPKPKANEFLHGSGVSPLQGARMTITNLHPSVSGDDIEELFGAVGALKKTRLLRPGSAEVVFVKREDAMSAFKTYHNRELDGQPMQCKLDSLVSPTMSTSASAAPLATSGPLLSSLRKKESAGRREPPPEVDPTLITKALFKTTGSTPTRPVTFTVKL